MTREEIIHFINNKILPTAEIATWEWQAYGKEIVADIVKAISVWRMGKPIDIDMTAKIIDGILYINNMPVKRIAAKLPRIDYSDTTAYWESKCLKD